VTARPREHRKNIKTTTRRKAARQYTSYPSLEWQIVETAKHYTRLTVRQLYYIMVSKYRYTPSRKFYKIFDYHLTKMRRTDPDLNEKFTDPTRHFILAPIPYRQIEIWVEKDSIRNFLGNLAVKYRLSIQVLRGFASLSMYRKALIRAAKRGVRKILYLGDFDPSGLLIEQVASKEMGIEIRRIGLTLDQVRKYKPPALNVNRRDSRAKDYISRYGDRCWEIESLRPRTLYRLIEEKLRENVPQEYLVEAETREKATRAVKPLTERLRRIIEQEAFRLLQEGRTPREITAIIAPRYDVIFKEPQAKGDSGRIE